MKVLGVILARAGSKGLPNKCLRPLLGRAVIEYTFEHVAASRRLTAVVFSTDSKELATLARGRGLAVIDRPEELATDATRVDDAARHAVERWEAQHRQRVEAVALLYGNIPVRARGLIDQAIELLGTTGADSVRSVAPVSKQHPDWLHRVEGGCLVPFRPNSIYRRQDLEPLYYHDGAAAIVRREALFGALRHPDDAQAFWGSHRRALVQSAEAAVDVDEPVDLLFAEAVLRAQGREEVGSVSVAGEGSTGAGG